MADIEIVWARKTVSAAAAIPQTFGRLVEMRRAGLQIDLELENLICFEATGDIDAPPENSKRVEFQETK
jgi:hypothetical protein